MRESGEEGEAVDSGGVFVTESRGEEVALRVGGKGVCVGH